MIDIKDERKKAIYNLANKISEEDSIGLHATNIMGCASSVSIDKFIQKHNERTIKKDVLSIKKKLHRISEYVEEIEAHIYKGELNDK